jgi:gamma-glutamyltranspeptidase / glutathione hydrolase
MRFTARFALAAALALPLHAGAFTGFSYTAPLQPEIASGYTEKPGWVSARFAVAAANPLATDAGFQVLRAGGSAVDAAIAVQMVLTLVEPQSSGIGGGAFLMHFDGQNIAAYDGRETAPMAVGETLFLDDEGKPLAFLEAATSGLSVGVPGVLRMLEMAHARHGKLPWAALFTPAIALAEEGFAVSARLHTLLETEQALRKNAKAAAFYYDASGNPLPVGHRLKNPALAAIFRHLAEHGGDAFYGGEMARDLVSEVQGHPERPGALSTKDLAAYAARVRDPMCTEWRTYRICGFPPPSSGHMAIMQMLGILEHAPPLGRVAHEGTAAAQAAETQAVADRQADTPLVDGIPGADWLHLFTEAARLAFADRGLYIADPDFVDAPGGAWTTLLAPDYLRERAALIGDRTMGRAEPGTPAPRKVSQGRQAEQRESGTSHISIVDAEGNALAMTTTIEAAFGARILADGGTGLAGGYLLNNELTDFSFQPADDAGRPIANRVEPGKRPRSSMSPTLVFDRESGAFIASLGSPGGAVIIHYTARTLIAMLEWGLDAQRAIDLPHAGTLGGPTFLEEARFPQATIEALQRRGHEVVERDLTSGLQAIRRTESGFFGGADPRREGIVMGE